MKTLFASAAAFGMAITPLAAQAGTRAADNTIALTRVDRGSPMLDKFDGLGNRSQERRDKRGLYFVIGGIAIALLLTLAISGAENDSSSGTGG